jgi:hypothetical protein
LLLHGAIATFLFAVAVVLALAATDVLAWRGQAAKTRVALSTGSRNPNSFEPETILPTTVSRGLLAADDDVEFDRALQQWSRVSHEPFRGTSGASALAQAELRLDHLARRGGLSAEARSDARLLHAILLFEELSGQSNTQTMGSAIARGIKEMKDALRVDPGNGFAKYDIEIMLRLLAPLGGPVPQPGEIPLKGSSSGVKGGGGSGGQLATGGGF